MFCHVSNPKIQNNTYITADIAQPVHLMLHFSNTPSFVHIKSPLLEQQFSPNQDWTIYHFQAKNHVLSWYTFGYKLKPVELHQLQKAEMQAKVSQPQHSHHPG